MGKVKTQELTDVERERIVKALTLYAEEWVTGEELCRKFQMFNKDWLKRYGHSLPRTCAWVRDEKGEVHKTRWAYASHEISRLIANNGIKQLRCLSVNVKTVIEDRLLSN